MVNAEERRLQADFGRGRSRKRRGRINGWRRNRRFSCSQQPAVRTVSRGCAGAAIGACLEEITRGWHQHWYRQDGCRSKNEFLERAVNYYADHLAAGTSTMLPRAVQSAIDGRLQLLEQRLSSLLFKQAVELDMGLSLLAECVNLDETVLRKQRAKSVNDVKRTNGQLRLEQKLRTQEPFDEWPD